LSLLIGHKFVFRPGYPELPGLARREVASFTFGVSGVSATRSWRTGESKLWKQLTPKVKEANFASSKPGELRVSRSKYKLVPDKQAQEYVNRIGASIVPLHQQELANGNL